MQKKKQVKGKTLQKVTLFTDVDFSFLKDKNLYRNKFSANKSLYKFFILLTFTSLFTWDLSSSRPQIGQKNKINQSIGFNPENQWLSAMLSLTTNGHQSSTKRTSSFPAESHSQMAVSRIHKDSERRAMVNRSGAWTLV